MSKVAVVIPAYKEQLNEFEQISLAQAQKVFGGKYPIIFFAPEGKRFSYFSAGNLVVQFPEQFFKSTQTYNTLMMKPAFYEAFLDYEYILIYQLDTFVFADKLEYFCSLGYDYIGAAWPLSWVTKVNFRGKLFKPRVGNGGFCLRKVKACYNLLINYSDWVKELYNLTEDVFFGVCGMIENSDFHTAPINVAYKFSTEAYMLRCINKNGGELPFGCHAWHNFSGNFYVKEFLKLGYDLRPLINQLKDNDSMILYGWLANISIKRLNNRIIKGKPLMRYLHNKNFASIRVIRSPYTMLILARLLMENINISDKIYLYDENEQDILISDLRPEKLPHLLIQNGGGR